ncbi:hypothetical protein ACN6MY_06980 [Peribacillus sp. B-H-3]|uniref:hypothetical protein n=1 Tax=Peribacillus sp. B-H-3 TaxID=3400420 RepID=UPI003B011D05
MKLLKWSYLRRNTIKTSFDIYPNSPVIFRRIRNYYFVYNVQWSYPDPAVNEAELRDMELLLNQELGFDEGYKNRKSKKMD